VIDWATLNPGLLELFARLSVDTLPTSFVVEHKDRPRTIMSTVHQKTLTMQVTSVVGIGRDEERDESVPADATGDDLPWAGEVRRTTVGHRRMTVRLVCDALVNTDTTWAWAAIERIRTRIQRRRTDADLKALGASLNRVGTAVEANFKKDSHVFNRVVLDIVFNVVVNDVESDPVGWIAQAELTSHVEDTDGTELPAAAQLTAVLDPLVVPS
jgi:hypothetical protein